MRRPTFPQAPKAVAVRQDSFVFNAFADDVKVVSRGKLNVRAQPLAGAGHVSHAFRLSLRKGVLGSGQV